MARRLRKTFKCTVSFNGISLGFFSARPASDAFKSSPTLRFAVIICYGISKYGSLIFFRTVLLSFPLSFVAGHTHREICSNNSECGEDDDENENKKRK